MPLKTKDSKLNLRSYTEILGQGDVAFAVKTDGLRFEFVDGGISSTGRWFLSRQKKFNKVIVYHSGQNGNIYIGDFDYWSVDSEDTEKYHIHFKNSRLAGNATVSWTQFTHGRNPGYSRIYLDNSNFLSTPPPGKKTPCKVTQVIQRQTPWLCVQTAIESYIMVRTDKQSWTRCIKQYRVSSASEFQIATVDT